MRVLIAFLLCVTCFADAQDPNDFRGAQFIGFDRFNTFQRSETNDSVVLLSPPINPSIQWNQLVVSWNYRGKPTNGIVIEAKAIYPKHETKWYTLAKWASEPIDPGQRASIRGQKDEDGRVDTDVLKLKECATAVEIRIQMRKEAAPEALKFIGLSFCDSQAVRALLPPKRAVWGTILNVKERSQANYPEGISEWCSPTSMSMLMSFWATHLNRGDLNYDVPEVARGVHDPNWPGTGNWPFNAAFAGAHQGMRAYVARLSDISELEDWIEAGIPVALSVSYGFLKGRPERANGHLVVCIGFDERGNIIVNDPGRLQVRQVYLRENLVKAWADSENTVYIVHPESWKVPPDRFGHWFRERH